MPGYNLNVLGLEVAFKTDVGPDRVKKAKALIEERFQELEKRGRKLSKEKLLIYLALSLADDYLQTSKRLEEQEKALAKLLHRLENHDK
ncbi:cell division protein ZapA [Desulfohalobiaceae bacterium Ax17]|jgi:cell division protein ZapA|uniref:cell division protein ZapA n=1 Tax=Desulfovulcanus ferrireducens TaxID=2831190 RepID=UPI00207BCA24|nr:cell division protein ZapA [Desulfovulcanus ferrireducens]MBT8763280.1 cell division protein ZapA [Desulfovulcanus ferrireducens]